MAPVVVVSSSPPSPIPPGIRSALTTALLTNSSVQTIHQTLHSSCESSGWLDRVRARTLHLLRNGECTTYNEVMETLIVEARNRDHLKDAVKTNGRDNKDGFTPPCGKQNEVDIRIPDSTIAKGLDVLKDALDKVVSLERGGED